MKTPVSQKVAQHLSTARRTTVLPPRVLDSLAQANIRFSYTRDLRRANSNQNFARLFQNDPRLVRREIVNWNLAEKEDKASPNYMPDEQTSVHLTMLFDAADKNTFCNLANPEAMDYLTDAHSRFFRFMRVRDFESVSLHLGFAAEELTKDPLDLHSVPQSKVLSRLEMMAHTLYSLLGLKRNLDEVGYSGKLLIETLDYQVDRVGEEDVSAYEHITDPGFLAEVLGRTGYGLLFDAAHLLISAENMGYAGHLQYVEAMLGGKGEDLHEIHLAVPEQTSARWLDNHRALHSSLQFSGAVKVLEIFDYLMRQRSLQNPITINFETPTETVDLDAFAAVIFLREVMGF